MLTLASARDVGVSPYIITTKRNRSPHTQTEHWVTSRRAVATLDEVFPIVDAAAKRACAGRPGFPPVTVLREEGRTVSPLPDGTVIEVEPMTWLALAADVDVPVPVVSDGEPPSFIKAEALNAFNAREASP